MKTRISMGFLVAMLIMMFAAATGPPALSGSAERTTGEEQMALATTVAALSIPVSPAELLLQEVTRTANQSPLWSSPAVTSRKSVPRQGRPRIRLPTGIG